MHGAAAGERVVGAQDHAEGAEASTRLLIPVSSNGVRVIATSCAQVFSGEATFLVSSAQAEDPATKDTCYLHVFRWIEVMKRLAAQKPREEVRALMIASHPEWAGQEWSERGVGCLCAEHTA